MNILKTDTANAYFLDLERGLDQELWNEFSEEMEHYAPHNKFIKPIKAVVLLSENNTPLACGAFKEKERAIEIKRMYVDPSVRGKGYGRQVLYEIEKWAKEIGYKSAILETGDTLAPAIRLYISAGYETIACYPPYDERPRSRCFGKRLI